MSPDNDPPKQEHPRRSAKNIAWLIAERTLKAIGGVGMGALIARHLGPDHYGSYGAAIGLATLAKEGVMLGFDRMIRRDLAARPHDAGKIIGSSVALALVIAIALGLILSAGANWLADDAEPRRLMIILVWMALPQAFFSCEIWFESSGQAGPLVWTRNVVWFSALAGRAALVVLKAGVDAFAIAALVEWIMTYAAVVWLLHRKHRRDFVYSVDKEQLRAWFHEGWPAVLIVILSADRVMVLLVRNLAPSNLEAGYLNAALRITEIWWSISVIIAAILLPRIVTMQKNDPARAEKVMQLYANASLMVGLVAAVGVSITAPILVPVIFGKAYAPSAIVMAIIFWSGVAVFPCTARSQLWITQGKLLLDLPSVAAVTLLQLSLSVIVVPRYGAVGAACAMTGAQFLGFYGTALLVPTMRRGSAYQWRSFQSLFSPGETIRFLRDFVAGAIKK
jgi:PST family polysaccharide transporter